MRIHFPLLRISCEQKFVKILKSQKFLYLLLRFLFYILC
jgi:hypothetical protein